MRFKVKRETDVHPTRVRTTAMIRQPSEIRSFSMLTKTRVSLPHSALMRIAPLAAIRGGSLDYHDSVDIELRNFAGDESVFVGPSYLRIRGRDRHRFGRA